MTTAVPRPPRLGRRAVTVSLTVAGLVALALAGPTGADAAPRQAVPSITIDSGGAPPIGAYLDQSSAAAAGAGSFVSALDVNGIRPGDGFALPSLPATSYNFGAYRFQLVTSPDGNVEDIRADLTTVAAQLTQLTQIQFSVAPGSVSRPGTVNTCGGSPNDHTCELFNTNLVSDTASWGTIRIEFSGASRCGTLVPFAGTSGVVGCGGPSFVIRPNGDGYLVRGSVWLAPALQNGGGLASLRLDVLAHEIGHALGLAHYGGVTGQNPYPSPTSGRQLMFPQTHDDLSDVADSVYHAGDVNGLRYMVSRQAWVTAAAYRDFLGRIPDTAGFKAWQLAGGTTADFIRQLSRSDEWVGRVVDQFYADAFGRLPDAGGRTFWINRIKQRGVPQVASELYGSPEYLNRDRPEIPGHVEGTLGGFVRALYFDLLGRAPESQAAIDFWVAATQSAGRTNVALGFYQTIENRTVRVRDLYCTLLDRGPDSAGLTYWANQVLTVGDLELAVFLASSAEYSNTSDDHALRPVAGPAELPAPCTGF